MLVQFRCTLLVVQNSMSSVSHLVDPLELAKGKSRMSAMSLAGAPRVVPTAPAEPAKPSVAATPQAPMGGPAAKPSNLPSMTVRERTAAMSAPATPPAPVVMKLPKVTVLADKTVVLRGKGSVLVRKGRVLTPDMIATHLSELVAQGVSLEIVHAKE